MIEEQVSIILGDEYDNTLRENLRTVLIRNGATTNESSWNVGGSQEIESLHIELEGRKITIEAETFVGLSISGPKSIIERIAYEIKELSAI